MPYVLRFCPTFKQHRAQDFLAGAFAGAFVFGGALAEGVLGFIGALFCVNLAGGALEGSALGCGTLGWGAFACCVLFTPFLDAPSLGGGGLFALAAFLRSNSAFCACSSCFLFHCSSFICFSLICHTTGSRRILALRA